MFTVDYDRRSRRVKAHLRGFWTPADIAPFAAAVGAAFREAIAHGGHFDAIAESFDFPVQSNEVAELMTSVMQAGMSQLPGRAAIVVGSQLNKIQAERTLAHPRLQVFLAMEDAEAWLAEPQQPAAS